jgi:hypothetical protein
MADVRALKNNFALVFALFALFLLISLVSFFPIAYKPNIFIVFLVVLVFSAEDFSVFFLFLALETLWLKYVQYPAAEVLFIAGAGLALYALGRWVVLGRKLGVFILLLLVTQVAFWAFFYRGTPFFTVSFLMEFLYNCIVSFVMYSALIWLKGKFILRTPY